MKDAYINGRFLLMQIEREINEKKMIKTKTATKRELRNSKIVQMYEDLKIKQKGMKSAVVEHIAKETKSSVTTVNRVVKEAFKPVSI